MATGDKLVTLDELKAVKDYITPANIGAKATQTAVSSPTASGTASAFIDTITQDAQGRITATKKTVAVTGVKGNSESSYKTGNVNLTAANIGAKATQTAVSSPTASGTSTAFIDTISQNTQGVISVTKKTVASASQSAAGLMSSSDKTKLDGIATGAQVNSITGVKGNSENSYRTGNVNLTPANIGAASQITIASTDTWADMYESFSTINTASAATFCCNGGNASTLLTGSNFTSTTVKGVLTRLNASTYDVMASIGESNALAIWRINDLSSASSTPTISGFSRLVQGVKGNSENSYRTGNVNLTPANIGAHQAGAYLVISSTSSYSGTVSSAVATNMVQVRDTSSATTPIRHQMYGSYDTDGYTSTHFAARVPALGSQPVRSAEIVISVNNSGDVKYSVSGAKAFRSAIEAPAVLELSSNVWSTIYGSLSKIPLESSAVVNCTSAFMGKIDGNLTSGRYRGVVSTTANNGDYDFLVSGGATNATQYLYSFRLSGFTSSGVTPTINRQGKIAYSSWS